MNYQRQMYSSSAKNDSSINRDQSEVDRSTAQSLIDACIAGDLDFIKKFLEAGHDVNKCLSSGWTLLLYAASYAQPHIVQHLLSIGADPNVHHEGYTPLMALSFSNKGSPEERMKCLDHLLDGKANVNATNKLRETALMYASKQQESDFVRKLLEHNALVNYADNEEKTALFYAVIDNRSEIVEILIENGADLDLRNYDGSNACDVAVMKGFEKLIPLLDVKCEDEIEDIKVESVIHWKDMFPNTNKITEDKLDNDVEGILYGMILENYKNCFCGIDLPTFLQLKEEDAEKLGIDISVHKKKFFDSLLKFHKYEWNNKLMKNDISQNFSAFEAVKVLGNICKQLSVMSSSIHFSKNYLDLIQENEDLDLSSDDKILIEEEIKNMKLATLKIKVAVQKIKDIVKYINEESSDLSLPIYIDKKSNNSRQKWIVVSVVSLASIYLFQMKTVKKLWNHENFFSKHLRNILLPNFLFNKFYKTSLFFKRT